MGLIDAIRESLGLEGADQPPNLRLLISTQDLIAEYLASGRFLDVVPVGSRVTCNPPPTDTDIDLLCLANSSQEDHETFAGYDEVVADGFAKGGSDLLDPSRDDIQSQFVAFRRHEHNLIVTTDDDFFRRFLAASSVAKRLNLLRKDDRIALFQAVLYGNQSDGFYVGS